MTVQDLKETRKQLEKAKLFYFKAIDNKNKAALDKDKVLEARYLGEMNGWLTDIKLLEVLIKQSSMEEIKVDETKTEEVVTQEVVKAPKAVEPKKVKANRAVVTIKTITVDGVSKAVEMTTDTDSHEWQIYRIVRNMIQKIGYEKVLGKEIVLKLE